MNPADLPLRDVHLPPAPSWWPLAPGWWMILAIITLIIVVVLAVLGYWRYQRYRRARWLRLFDHQIAAAPDPVSQIAAVSELLRRAARQVDRKAVQLQGSAWLRFLDGSQPGQFSRGAGRLLVDGSFKPHLEEAQVNEVCQLARHRFIELMSGRR